MVLTVLKKILLLTEKALIQLLGCLVKLYQLFVSPMLGNCCRFYPSCSRYFCHSLNRYGLIKGFWFGVKRLCKCNPFFEGGFDPVEK